MAAFDKGMTAMSMLTGGCSFESSVGLIDALFTFFTRTKFAPLCMLGVIINLLKLMEANKNLNTNRMETKCEGTNLHKLMPLIKVDF